MTGLGCGLLSPIPIIGFFLVALYIHDKHMVNRDKPMQCSEFSLTSAQHAKKIDAYVELVRKQQHLADAHINTEDPSTK
jgi:hypothetical protein